MPDNSATPFSNNQWGRFLEAWANYHAEHIEPNGKANKMYLSIDDVPITLQPSDFKKIRHAYEATKGRDAQVSIVDKKAYTVPVYDPDFLVLGDITLGAKGIVTSKKDGTQRFDGYIGAYNDLYDFNSSTHRNVTHEAATRALSKFPGTPFEIEIRGHKSFSQNYSDN